MLSLVLVIRETEKDNYTEKAERDLMREAE